MFKHLRRRNVAGVVAFALAGTVGISAYAFTASNTVPAEVAGAGSGAVSAYTITQEGYTFDPAGENVEAVSFQLSSAANDVKIALTPAAPTAQSDWTDCGNVAANTTVTCTLGTKVPNADALLLSVAAVGDGTVTIAAS
jgi:hypothetical protein